MLASLRLLRCPSLARLAPPLTRSLSKTSTKPPNMAGTLSSKTTKSGEAFKDLRPLVPREPEVDEETGFDSDTAENWIMFPTKEAVREGIFKDYLKLTEELRKNHPGDERVDDTQAIITIGAHYGLHRGRVTAIIEMRLMEEEMRKAGEDVSDQHQKDFDMDMLLEEQDFRSVGIKCLDMNDYQVEYAGQGVATRPVKTYPGFTTVDLTDAELVSLEKAMAERLANDELERREGEKTWKRSDMSASVDMTADASAMLKRVEATQKGEEKGRKRWKVAMKNIVSKAQAKKGMEATEDCFVVDTMENTARAMTKKEFKDTSWGGRKMRGLWLGPKPITKQL